MTEQGKTVKVSRRDFARLTGVGASGFILGSMLPGSMAQAAPFSPSVFIQIPEAGPIRLVCHRAEMGQGVRTALSMILAEELDADLEQCEVVQGLADPVYGDQNTDGSRSIIMNYDRFRQMGAAARTMLQAAAAKRWSVPASQVRTEAGRAINVRTGATADYGSLALAAGAERVPSSPRLKSSADFKLIGKNQPSVDLDGMVDGTAVFAGDMEVPGLAVAALLRSPTRGGELIGYDASRALAVPGILKVFTIQGQAQPINSDNAIAVVGENTWAVLKARDLIEARWRTGREEAIGSDTYYEQLRATAVDADRQTENEGNIERNRTENVHRSAFFTPFDVHAPMEPPVALAIPDGNALKVYAPVQDAQRARSAIASAAGIDDSQVELHVTLLGGGFGRKSQPDFVVEAALVARGFGGPVRLQWTREDEIRHGFYHAAAAQQIEASLDERGYPVTWEHNTVFPTLVTVYLSFLDTPAANELDMGASNLPYRIPNRRLNTARMKSPLRVGWKRAVCNCFHAFAVNGMVDELAEKAGIDPVRYRLDMLGAPRSIGAQDTGRLSQVIREAADLGDWQARLDAGAHLGFASHYSFSSYVAMVVEVAKGRGGRAEVVRVDCAVDAGRYVNADGIRAQMEGGIIYGLSQALSGRITFTEGAVDQQNFNDFQVLRHNQSPEIRVRIIDSGGAPGGAGEPGVPPLIPALASALHHLTGERQRDLPLQL